MSNLYQQELIHKFERCAEICGYCSAQNMQQASLPELETGIRMTLDCASVCRAMALELTMDDITTPHLCQVCAFICTSCGEELERLCGMGIEHSSECSQACAECAQACQYILSRLNCLN
jgi:hypothetical protein